MEDVGCCHGEYETDVQRTSRMKRSSRIDVTKNHFSITQYYISSSQLKAQHASPCQAYIQRHRKHFDHIIVQKNLFGLYIYQVSIRTHQRRAHNVVT